jgi:DNA ligase (NAD+)
MPFSYCVKIPFYTKKTDYLLIGKSPGSKLEKAKQLGLDIIKEDAFKDLLIE